MVQADHATIEASSSMPRDIVDDLAYLRTAIVNVFFYGPPGAPDRGWVLIDTGMFGFADRISGAAARRFGPESRPAAIVLTHGHFDHIGAAKQLATDWDVPVYAHPLELPYLTGRSSYPPPDPSVGGGAMAMLSPLYPRGPIDLGERVQPLPADGSVPGMPGWRWLHTPGHTPGHVALFRDSDRTLLAGDAFTTTRQESATAVMKQTQEMHGPPAYYTQDWQAAFRSVEQLDALEPEVAVTGHGVPMRGSEMRSALHELAQKFDRLAFPQQGRYIKNPVIADASGTVYVPPADSNPQRGLLVALGATAVAGLFLAKRSRSSRHSPRDRHAHV